MCRDARIIISYGELNGAFNRIKKMSQNGEFEEIECLMALITHYYIGKKRKNVKNKLFCSLLFQFEIPGQNQPK